MLTLADLIEALTGVRPDGTDLVLTEACIDSRQAIPGSLFVAMKGERVDGHDYVTEAFRRGASVAIIERPVKTAHLVVDLRSGPPAGALPAAPFCLMVSDTLKALQQAAGFWRSKMNVRVVGITGSVGKSTTKELVAQVLRERYCTLKNQGNLNNEIGLPLTLLRLTEGHQRAVLEMGFYVPGEIKFLCDLARPVVGVVTNVGTVHALRAGSQEVIARGKAELVEALPPDGVAILNRDDPWVAAMAEKTRARVFFYGLDPEADLWADEVESLGLEGIRFKLHYGHEALHMRAPLIGRHSVHTVLRAAAVGLAEGLAWAEISAALHGGQAQLRLVASHTESGALILDDTYNASPESTLAALNLLADLDGRKVAVLGDMLELGPYEQQGHEMVGARAAEVADEVVAVGERGKMIAEAALTAGKPVAAVSWFETTQQAAEYLQRHLKDGDVVLVKGSRGMRMEQIVAALEVPA
ncbi:MAG TPA: UDP-N-acetylmuramoyl-tripeptide--D-alanyl-D-alanine ligase [Anaerolineaceae bacterium]|nr:UDP-N-acetylmuramoyl-tripeptide--D-alanyl-D-alanine ligase [Anaerolineaceae bacterium]HPN51477.1 UDP-N-acetylmuramoyl-tripeptide--D-alanyl-D-alanine ligase [Anaerolineaceae bacterium]